MAALFPCVQALFSALGFEVSPKLSSSDKDAHNVRQALSQPGADDVVIAAGQFNFAYCPELAPAHIEVLPVFVSPPAPSACALAIRDLEERLDHAKKLGIPPEACAGDQARLQTMRADADAAAAAGYLRAYVRERQYNAAAAHVSGPLPTERYGCWYVPGPVVYGINPCTLAREPTGGLPEVHVSVPGTTPGYFICTKNNGAFTGGYRSTRGGGQTRLRGWADAAGCIWEAR